MFTRIVEITAKTGMSRELAKTIQEKVLPILKKQPGFVDETLLLSETEPDRMIAQSTWNKREDAERYHNNDYKLVRETVEQLMAGDPVVRTFHMHSSTVHRTAAGKAA
jgi:quinol monooxygenase YgiN